jgi:hypothetical protein
MHFDYGEYHVIVSQRTEGAWVTDVRRRDGRQIKSILGVFPVIRADSSRGLEAAVEDVCELIDQAPLEAV